jgi:hypothetical protein
LISFAGEGKLRDGNTASTEFREVLGHAPSSHLERYANECLDLKFDDSGLALQDVINQVGRRLGFVVTDGRYRGTSSKVGYDGLWKAPEKNDIVVEVKTTDAYRIDLRTVDGYRRSLIKEDQIAESTSSILIVIGRQDAGDLEAQIRGSRHAWDIRLISVEYLLKLLKLKEDVEEPGTATRIRAILAPQEFTRVDGIIDLLFSTAEDVLQEERADEEQQDEETETERAPKFTPVAFHEACVKRIESELGIDLVRRSRATFTTPDDRVALVCAVSREYETSWGKGYWYAFHPHQKETLEGAKDAYVAFGCGSPESVILIPFVKFAQWLDGMNQTVLDDGRYYWHVHVHREGDRYTLARKKGESRPDLTSYALPARATGVVDQSTKSS